MVFFVSIFVPLRNPTRHHPIPKTEIMPKITPPIAPFEVILDENPKQTAGPIYISVHPFCNLIIYYLTQAKIFFNLNIFS